ncbi:MAG: hypothetical protein ABIO70_07840 [Pseudomonadota bacterium]
MSQAEGTTPRPGAVHLAAAVLLPLLLVAGALTWAAWERPIALSVDAQAIEAALAKADPEVVLLGASTVADDINAHELGQALADHPIRVAKLAKGATTPPVWYLLAKERLFGPGLRPRVLVIGSTPRALMETEVGSLAATRVINAHMTRYDPLIAEKAYHQARQSAARSRIERTRVALRGGFQDLVRAWSVGLLFGEGEGSLAERGQRVAEPALARAFGAAGSVDLSLQRRVIPVVDVVDEE